MPKPTKPYLPRIADGQLEKLLASFPAVSIEGPKWCGKTRTAEERSKSTLHMGDTSSALRNRKLAAFSPRLVLAGSTPRLIDEWQEVPQLWNAVSAAADETADAGRYLLTSSWLPSAKAFPAASTSRIARLRMRPMSLWESRDSSGLISLEDLCKGQITPAMTGEEDLRHLIYLIVRGGWPGNVDVPAETAHLLPRNFLRTLLNEDIPQAESSVIYTSKLRLVLRALARQESRTAGMQTLIRDIWEADSSSVSERTLSSYLKIFERHHLVDSLRAFTSSVRTSVRLKQVEKRHLCDPSLAAALLGFTSADLLNDFQTLEHLFKALCIRDLRIYAESAGGSLCCYQDYLDREIDAVALLPGGQWAAFDIRLGANQIDAAARNLLRVRSALVIRRPHAEPPVLCVLCGLSIAAFQRPDGVFVIPLTALKP